MFIILTLTKMRQALIEAIPASLRYAIGCGIGMLIAFVGLMDAGIIVAHPATLVTLGNVVSLPVLLSLFGLVVTSILLVKNTRGAMPWGILITALVGIPLGIVKYQGLVIDAAFDDAHIFKNGCLGSDKIGFNRYNIYLLVYGYI